MNNPSSPKSKFTGIWIPSEIWSRPDISIAEKALYGSIHALGGYSEEGCYASNQFFASRFHVTDGGIKNMLTSLRKADLIDETSIKDGVRYIWLKQPPIRKPAQTPMTPSSFDDGGGHPLVTPPSSFDDPEVLPHICRDKSIEKSGEGWGKPPKASVIPASSEAREYASTIGMSDTESDGCFDHFQSNGWLVGKNKMKDWKAAWRNWHRRSEQFSTVRKGYTPASPSSFDPFANCRPAERVIAGKF